MSDTPRCDAEEWTDGTIPADFARQLERELAEAKAEIERMRKVVDAAIAWRHLGQIRDIPGGEDNLTALAYLDNQVREYEESK